MDESFAHRRLSVHQLFGGGNVADIVLWRKWSWSVLVLVSSTSIWLLFKSGEYNLMSFIVNVLLLLHIILFLWAKSASLLNRPLPVIPDLEISDSLVDKAVEVLRVWIDQTLWIASEISVAGNVQLLVQVAVSLWIISVIGNLTDFITFIYIFFYQVSARAQAKETETSINRSLLSLTSSSLSAGAASARAGDGVDRGFCFFGLCSGWLFGALLCLSLPLLYENYQEPVDEVLILLREIIRVQWRKFDENVLCRIPVPVQKEKKRQ